MLPELIGILSLAAAGGSDSGGRRSRFPKPSDPVMTWPTWRIFRPPPSMVALGQVPDLPIPVAIGAPLHTHTPLWDYEKNAFEAPPDPNAPKPPPHPKGFVTMRAVAFYPGMDHRKPAPAVLKAARAAGIILATSEPKAAYTTAPSNYSPYGRPIPAQPAMPLFIDISSDLAEHLERSGINPNNWAPRQALEWGFNLAALPDSPDSSLYTWHIVHPWPAHWSKKVYDRQARDALAHSLLERGRLLQR
jgi:hypothetical protein